MKKGFTLIEVLIVVFVIGILSTITINYFKELNDKKKIEGLSESIAAYLEETKTKAQSGENGEQHGIKFYSQTYVIFSGTSFSLNDPDNKTINVDDGFEIETSLTGDEVIFSRINGEPNHAGTITITSLSDESKTIDVVIGNLGDISVIK